MSNVSLLNTSIFIRSDGSAVSNIFVLNKSGYHPITVSSGGYFVSNTISGGYLRLQTAAANSNTLIDMNVTLVGGAGLNNNVLSNTNVAVANFNGAVSNSLYGSSILHVDILGVARYNTVYSGASIIAGSGQITVAWNTFNSGSYLSVNNASISGNTMNNAIVDINDGLINSNTFVDTTINVNNTGNLPNLTKNTIKGGTINANQGLIYNNDIDQASINILSNGNVGNNDITSSLITIKDSSVYFRNNQIYGGQVDVFSGYVYGNTFYSGSLLNVYSGGSLKSNTIISAGASAVLYDGATLSGTLTLNSGGYVVITTSTGGIVNLVDNTIPVYLLDQTTTLSDFSTGLVISGTGSATTVISGFTGKDSDQITLANVQTSNVVNVTYPDVDHVTFTLNDGTMTTLNITGVGNYGYALGSDSNANVVYEVCFLTGTMITIPNGICAVEELTIGDLVLVYDPVTQTKVSSPIKWIGHKKVSVKPNLHSDEAGYPVRILKDAIAQNVPNKDLLITPEHCLYFNDKFVPVRMLVNGYSIFYDTSITSYDYYHIETEEHSILTADGTLTESYLDTGNRHTFNQDQKVIELSGDKVKTWQEDAIAPLTVERSFVEGIYNNILQRTNKHNYPKQKQPFELTQDPDICLMTNQGEFIYKEVISTDKKPIFILPNTINAVWVISRTSRPCDVIGPFIDDRRYLGVLVGDITLQRNSKNHLITTHIETDHLLGWDVKETVPCRWTKGKAFLPLNIKSHSNTPTILTLNILSEHSYIIDQVKDNKKQA